MGDMEQRRSDLSEVAKQIWQPLVILLLSTGNRTDPNEDLLFHCFFYVLCVCPCVYTRVAAPLWMCNWKPRYASGALAEPETYLLNQFLLAWLPSSPWGPVSLNAGTRGVLQLLGFYTCSRDLSSSPHSGIVSPLFSVSFPQPSIHSNDKHTLGFEDLVQTQQKRQGKMFSSLYQL